MFAACDAANASEKVEKTPDPYQLSKLDVQVTCAG
jgi:hypothetical protein